MFEYGLWIVIFYINIVVYCLYVEIIRFISVWWVLVSMVKIYWIFLLIC